MATILFLDNFTIGEMAGGLLAAGIFIAILIFLAKKEQQKLEEAKASIPQDVLDYLTGTPPQPYQGKSDYIVTKSVVIAVKPSSNKVKLKVLYYNFPYHTFADDKIHIAADIFQTRQIKTGDIVDAIARVDKDNVTSIKGMV